MDVIFPFAFIPDAKLGSDTRFGPAIDNCVCTGGRGKPTHPFHPVQHMIQKGQQYADGLFVSTCCSNNVFTCLFCPADRTWRQAVQAGMPTSDQSAAIPCNHPVPSMHEWITWILTVRSSGCMLYLAGLCAGLTTAHANDTNRTAIGQRCD